MSIILKGIDMPEDVHGKTVLDEIRLIFSNANTRYSILLDKDDIVEIPTPHGRIIDEDEIYEQPHCGECNDATLDAIDNAPTILEAEETDERQ